MRPRPSPGQSGKLRHVPMGTTATSIKRSSWDTSSVDGQTQLCQSLFDDKNGQTVSSVSGLLASATKLVNDKSCQFKLQNVQMQVNA
jgi:hypothetical protein